MQHYGQIDTAAPAEPTEARPLGRSLLRGWRGRCPACGEGRLFYRFLKPVDDCGHCGEMLHHQRSDDLPPYLVIFIVGHLVISGYLVGERFLELNSWQHLAIWVPVTLILSILMLQPLKGAVIGLQWSMRMHGFSGEDDKPADPLDDDRDRSWGEERLG